MHFNEKTIIIVVLITVLGGSTIAHVVTSNF